MSKEQVINYVMTTPGNPNRAVLEGMLDSIAQSGGTEPLIVSEVVEDSNTRLDKTWQEIYDAFPNVMLQTSNRKTVATDVRSSNGLYTVSMGFDTYAAHEANDYPILEVI